MRSTLPTYPYVCTAELLQEIAFVRLLSKTLHLIRT